MATQAEYDKLQSDFINLNNEHEELKKKQEDFQNALIQKIEEYKALNPFTRFFKYGKLFWDIVSTIEEGIRKANQK